MPEADKCVKGFPCKLSCIPRTNNCLGSLSEDNSKIIGSFVSILLKSNFKINDGIDEVLGVLLSEKLSQKQINSIKKLGDKINNNEMNEAEIGAVTTLLSSIALNPKAKRNASRVPSFKEIENAYKKSKEFESAFNNSFDQEGKFNPRLDGGMGSFIKKNSLINKDLISDNTVDLIYDILPSEVLTKLSTKGQPEKYYSGKSNNGETILLDATEYKKDKTAKEARKKFLIKRYLEQGGLDGYTGLPIDIMLAEPEHMVANNKAKGLVDDDSNLVWSSASLNNHKAGQSDDPLLWAKKLEEEYLMGEEEYNKKRLNPSLEKANSNIDKLSKAKSEVEENLLIEDRSIRMEMGVNLLKSYGATKPLASNKTKYLTDTLEGFQGKSSYPEYNPLKRAGAGPSGPEYNKRTENIGKNLPKGIPNPLNSIYLAAIFFGTDSEEYTNFRDKLLEIKKLREIPISIRKEALDTNNESLIKKTQAELDKNFFDEYAKLISTLPDDLQKILF